MTVVWTETALRHLRAIHEYIAQDSPRHAQGMVDRITRRTETLVKFPLMGAVVAEYHDPNIREVLERPYRIFYRASDESVDILAVLHGARRVPNSLPE